MPPFRLPGRWVPPAYTPIPLEGLLRAMGAVVLGRDDRDQLAWLLGDLYEADSVVLTDSGTSALQLAMREVGPIDDAGRPRIALPAFACFDLVTAAVGADAVPVFYDLVPHTLEPEWSSFQAALEADVDAVVVAPLFGLPGGWPKVRALADAAGVPIIEDAAQGFGSAPGGRRAGTLGNLTVLSFGRGKGWTGGGGGALLGRGKLLASPRFLSGTAGSVPLLGRSVGQWTLGTPLLYAVPANMPGLRLGETRYHAPGTPRRIARASATLALATAKAATSEAERRSVLARRLVEKIDGDLDRWAEDGGYLRLPVIIPEGADAFARENARLGVQRSYPLALPALDALDTAGSTQDDWPGARRLATQLVTLPTHSRVSDAEIDILAARVVAAGGRPVGPRSN